MTRAQKTPSRFKAYVGLLCAGAVASVAFTEARGAPLGLHLVEMVLFAALIAALEWKDLPFYETEESWGLSASEAVMVPMLVSLSFPEVVITALVAMAAARIRRYGGIAKELFNVAQFGCGAAAAGAIWAWLSDPAAAFAIQDALAATLGVVALAASTHVFVAAGFHLAGRGRFVKVLTGDVAPVLVMNLAGNIALGLLFGAAYAAARWTLALFPLALVALYFGYRAVVRQGTERRRMERLHAASRSLVGAPNLAQAVDGFLRAVAEAGSAVGARAVVRTANGFHFSSVYAGEPVEVLTPLGTDSVARFLEDLEERKDATVSEKDVARLGKVGYSARNLIGVPIVEDDRVAGLLTLVDRVGVDEFGADDIRFLRALANELALSLQSYRASEQVAEEREKFQLLVEAVSDYAIYMLDPHGKVVSWNAGAERIMGYASEQIVGRHFSCFYPTDDSGWDHELTRATREQRVEVEGWRVRKDGSRFLVNEVVAPVLDGAMRLRGFAKVTRDITERVRARKEKEELTTQLHQSQKLESVGQLAGGIAHDFNNLLSVILNCSHLVTAEIEPGSTVHQDVVQIKEAAQRAASLTRQLLVFSRRDLIEPRLLSLNEVITGLQKLIARAIGEDIVIKTSLDADIGWIKADPSQVEQVLINLAVNARDAMPGGGTLTIETFSVELDPQKADRYLDLEPGSYVGLRVSDTGHGMSPAVMQKAFDPFFTTKPKGSGTGLGLATVYGIVRGAGGHVQVRSQERLGTSFEVLLPQFEEPPVLHDDDAVTPKLQGRGERVLLVEDEDALRAIAARILTQNGYEVIEARNGRDALFRLEGPNRHIDLLLSDIVMPEMSGVELATRLREGTPDLKVILTSGYSSRTFSSAQVDAEVLQKPFEPNDLLQLVREVLEQERLAS